MWMQDAGKLISVQHHFKSSSWLFGGYDGMSSLLRFEMKGILHESEHNMELGA